MQLLLERLKTKIKPQAKVLLLYLSASLIPNGPRGPCTLAPEGPRRLSGSLCCPFLCTWPTIIQTKDREVSLHWARESAGNGWGEDDCPVFQVTSQRKIQLPPPPPSVQRLHSEIFEDTWLLPKTSADALSSCSSYSNKRRKNID